VQIERSGTLTLLMTRYGFAECLFLTPTAFDPPKWSLSLSRDASHVEGGQSSGIVRRHEGRINGKRED